MELVVIGSSGHGRVVAEAAQLAGHKVMGFIDDITPDGEVDGLPRLGGCDKLPKLALAHPGLGVAVGIGDNHNRLAVAERVRKLAPTLNFPTIIHPTAVVATNTVIGAGSVILATAVINVGANLGELVLINTRAVVEHDAELGLASSLAPGAIVAGHCRLGEGAAVMMGALVREKCLIGSHALVGMGAVVTANLPPNTVSWGNPAHTQRLRASNEPYL